jgi:LysR family transcriptional regulator, glycine cleavage system transcriptional activator
MRRRVPLNAIRAFEAAARHRSVTRAANELHVTPTAVSHQIKFLENFLQSKLFIRRNSRLELTPDSEACLGKISGALDLIDNALVQLKQPEERRERFTVGASASFTSLWLMPRIQSFVQSAPEIDMTLKTFLHRAAIESEQPDIQICNWETSLDRKIEPLMDEEVIPVCSVELFATYGGVSPGVLEELPLIHFERRVPAINGQYPDWAHYLREFGVHRQDITSGPKFNHNVAAIDAARAGLGVLLARSVLVEGCLERKELVQVGEAYPIRSRYYLVTPWTPEAPRASRRFKEWLYGQVATSKRVHAF